MTMGSFLKGKGAPLNDPIWSCGALRERDKTVILRAWQDNTQKFNALGAPYYIRVARADGKDRSLGAAERRQHRADSLKLPSSDGYVYCLGRRSGRPNDPRVGCQRCSRRRG